MAEVPPPIPSPSVPDLGEEDTGEHPAVTGRPKKKRPSMAQTIAIGAVSTVLGSGGSVVFLLGFAERVEAKSVAAAQALATVQGQRVDVLADEQKIQKARLESIDAGVAETVRRLEKKIDAGAARSEERGNKQEEMLRQILVESRKK